MTEIKNEIAVVSEKSKWLLAIGLSILFILAGTAYIYFTYVTDDILVYLSFLFASTASLMFATALSMGSLNYFFGWPNMRHGFQKQIGIMAFWWSLLYSLTLPILYPELYWTGLSQHLFSADVILGSLSMAIFSAMVLINSRFIAPHVTREKIFFVLGLGYVGYALLVIRAIVLEFDLWLSWLQTLSSLPPGRLVLSVIAFMVLLLRLMVAISKHRKQTQTIST